MLNGGVLPVLSARMKKQMAFTNQTGVTEVTSTSIMFRRRHDDVFLSSKQGQGQNARKPTKFVQNKRLSLQPCHHGDRLIPPMAYKLFQGTQQQ